MLDCLRADRDCTAGVRSFNNVEVVTAEKIGIETTAYVRNIYKYYVSYRLTLDMHQQIEKARQQVTPGKI